MPSFDHDDPRYKCGSGCCRAITASVVIGVLEVIAATALLIKVIWNSDDIKDLGLLILCIYILINSLTLIAAVIMSLGIYHRKANLIMPHLLVQVICMVCLVIIMILVGLSYLILKNKRTVDEDDDDLISKEDKLKDSATNIRQIEIVNLSTLTHGNDLQTIMTAVLATCGATFLFEIWIFVIVLACYRYLRDRALFGSCPTSVPFA